MATSDARAPILERVPAGAPRASLVPRLLEGAIDGFLLEGALTPDVAYAAAAAAAKVPARRSPRFPGDVFGALLLLSAPDLSDYFAAKQALEAALAETGAVEAIHRALADAAQPLGAARPVHATGVPYAPVTVRSLPPGESIAVHSEQWEWEAMRHLRTLVDPARHLSFYVPLAPADRGGDLIVYHRPTKPPSIEGLPEERVHALLASYGESVWRPGLGDLLFFDGGRFNHRVTAVVGETSRVTIGGFAACSSDRATLYTWS